MGGFSGANIATDGLVLYIDAANDKSYPGSGTDAYDISGNNRHCTMNNGAATANDPISVFTFDGVDDTITTNSVQNYITSNLSIDIFVKVGTHGNFNDYVSNNWVNSGWLLYSTSTDWYFSVAQSGAQYGARISHNNNLGWTHLVGAYDGTQGNLYVNGELVDTSPEAPDGATFDSNVTIRIGAPTEPGSYKIGFVRLYDRALTADEVRQNFNATRARFGM